jgi:hypothetical protein
VISPCDVIWITAGATASWIVRAPLLGQGLSASRENEPSRGDPLPHPDASPQSRPAWCRQGGRPSLRRLASFRNPCNPAAGRPEYPFRSPRVTTS